MAGSDTRVPLWLDHVSIAVPDFRAATTALERHLGLGLTVSPAEPDRHGRIHLDRSYLEISSRDPVARWHMPYFFLRFDDPAALRRHLEASGLSFRFGSYTGIDGRWDDVVIEAGSAPLPILVRRTEPAEIAADWPPAISGTHRCGARTLEAVHVTVRDLEEALDAYARLLGRGADRSVHRDAGRCAVLSLEAGRIVLIEGDDGAGVRGISLGVPSLPEAVAMTAPSEPGRTAWVDPVSTHGLRIGFVETSTES